MFPVFQRYSKDTSTSYSDTEQLYSPAKRYIHRSDVHVGYSTVLTVNKNEDF